MLRIYSNLYFMPYFYSIKNTFHSTISIIVRKVINWLSQVWQSIQTFKIKLLVKRVSIQQRNTINVALPINEVNIVNDPLSSNSLKSSSPVTMNKVFCLPKSVVSHVIFEFAGREPILPAVCRNWRAAYPNNQTIFNDYKNCSDWFLGPIVQQASQHLRENSSEKDFQLCLLYIQQAVVDLAKKWPDHQAILEWSGHPVHFKRISKISEWIKERSVIDFAQVLSENIYRARELPNLLNISPENKSQVLKEWIKEHQSTILELDLEGNFLKVLPDCIGEFKSLQGLYLSRNELQSIPDTIGKLTALRELHLDHNELQSIPDTIGKLTALRELHLGHNELQSIPDTIGQLLALQKLSLGYNELQSIPDTIGQLLALQKLSLGYNELQSIPDTIGQLLALQKLSLGYNELQSIPDTIGQLLALQKLSLGYNQLKSIPDMIGRLTILEELDLYGNPLRSIDEVRGQLSNCNRLRVFVI